MVPVGSHWGVPALLTRGWLGTWAEVGLSVTELPHLGLGGPHPSYVLQLQYLNRYYQIIREKVGPELQRRQLQEEFSWLQRHTEPLTARAAPTTSLAPLVTVSALAILGWSV